MTTVSYLDNTYPEHLIKNFAPDYPEISKNELEEISAVMDDITLRVIKLLNSGNDDLTLNILAEPHELKKYEELVDWLLEKDNLSEFEFISVRYHGTE